MVVTAVESRVRTSIESLFRSDGILLAINSSERSICHRLARHMEVPFASWNVDCEYNRDGHDNPKLVDHLRQLRRKAEQSVFPDIVVHRRTLRGNRNNLLVVEVKKSTSTEGEDIDLAKLRIFTTDFKRQMMNYHYQSGLFIEFSAWRHVPAKGTFLAAGIWFQEGQPVGELLKVEQGFSTETTKSGRKVVKLR